jgi:hypothetical protein
MSESSPELVVGVFPGGVGAIGRPRLLSALELAFPVRFEERRPGELRGIDAVLDWGNGVAAREAAARKPALLLLGDEPADAADATPYELADAPELDPRLRGARLPDRRLVLGVQSEATGDRPGPQATVLGRWGEHPVWWAEGRLRVAVLAPRELDETEALRDRLGEERSLALLPLVAFLRELCAEVEWTPPPPRAAFVFDDPNLHWPTYGYVDLPALSAHAGEHGYHAALATVPLDARWTHPAALAALAESEGAISLAVHGNDHNGGELGRLATRAAATALAAQALRRIARFERRTGQEIERVMVPPHEACSAVTVAALLCCGFEAISMTLPYPWLGVGRGDWLARPKGADALVGWRGLERTAGLPTILRHPLAGRSAAELRLRAYLDQPLVLYGHHDDLADGLDVLAEAKAEVDAIAPGTEWTSLASIARRSYETRLEGEGETLVVRPLGNRLEIELPAGVRELRVERPAAGAIAAPRPSVAGRTVSFGEPVALTPGATRVKVALGPIPLEVAEIAPPPRRPLAVVRRLAGESRDRLAPILAR